MILLADKPFTSADFTALSECYIDYIKYVVDIENGTLCAGGEYHIDCEEILVRSGSNQSNLYGGGVRLSTKTIEYMAMSNFKPALGMITYEISDPVIRSKMKSIVQTFFGNIYE
jgi:hypothetical protein